MSCSVVVRGSGFCVGDWGISQNQAGFKATTSVSVTERVDKVEGRDSCGKVVAVVFYNKTSEVSIEGIGSNKKQLVLQYQYQEMFLPTKHQFT